MAWEYYAFLGLHPDASLEEIKLAAARKRRELEIARDTPGKAYLNEVTRVLRDAQARVEYDTLQQHGDIFSQLLRQADEAEADEEWPEAIRIYRQALETVPDHPLLLNRLAYALAEHGDFREAEKIYAALVKRYPDSSIYWSSYGAVCFDLANRIATQQPAATSLVDLLLTGVQSSKRLSALQALSVQLDISYEDAKVIAKSLPYPLATFIERELAENLARTLRAAGALVKVMPAQGKRIDCPYCGMPLNLSLEEGLRSLTCSYCDESFKIYKGDREALLRQGREYYQRAIALDPTDTDLYMQLARSYSNQEQYAQAAEWVEKAILSDGVENYDDVGFLAELCRLAALMGQPERIEPLVARIRAALPDDSPMTREMVGMLFDMLSGNEGNYQRFASAKILAEIGLRFAPTNPNLRTAVEAAENLVDSLRELTKMQNDIMILDPVRDIARVLVAEAAVQTMEPQQARLLEKAFESLHHYTRSEVRPSVKRLKTKYPAVYRITGRYFATVLGDEL